MGLDHFSIAPAGHVLEDGVEQAPFGNGIASWAGREVSIARRGELVVLALGSVDDVRGGAGLHHSRPADVVLTAWERWGADAMDRLVGPWVAVLWDGQAAHALRDITGSRPVYLAASPRGDTIAGTDLRRVLAARGGPPRADQRFVAHYVNGTFPSAETTPYAGIEATAPGSVATHRGGRWTQRRVAEWVPHRERVRDLDHATDLVADALDRAVADRVHDRASAAVALSGGLDSTNVLASLVAVAPSTCQVRALAVPFYSPEGDERRRQQMVADHCGVDLEWVSVEGAGAVTGFGTQFLSGRHWPPIAGNWFLQDGLAQAADDRGVSVLLDGEDADSSFGGDRAYLPDLLLRGRWPSWWAQAEAYVPYGVRRRSTLRYSLTSLLPPALDHRVSGTPRAMRVSARLSPALAAGTGIADELAATSSVRIWAPGRRFSAAQRLAGEPGQVSVVSLETSAGGLGRHVDVLHPFLDRRVMELAMGLPWWSLTYAAWRKVVLRQLARRRLPVDFAASSRKANLAEYYRTAALGRERALILDGLQEAARRSDVFAPAALHDLTREFTVGDDVWTAVRTAVLALWLRSLDQAGEAHPGDG